MTSPAYRGRFAPSPTGPLHFGSLVAAVASFLQAKSQHGLWLLRIEDLDIPRNQAGAADGILRCLDAHGLHWDQQPIYQTQRLELYEQALQQLFDKDLLFYCTCSRKLISETAVATGVYPGTCRRRIKSSGKNPFAIRIKVPALDIRFVDVVCGEQSQNLATEVGDFVLRRADNVFAYQLAVVVDDYWQGISEVVRGQDLLDNTARQIYLQQQLQYNQPSYFHVPIVTNPRGEKLSKQTGAAAIDPHYALSNLRRAYRFLGQVVDDRTLHAIDTVQDFWQWAQSAWNPSRIAQRGISIN